MGIIEKSSLGGFAQSLLTGSSIPAVESRYSISEPHAGIVSVEQTLFVVLNRTSVSQTAKVINGQRGHLCHQIGKFAV